MVTVCLYCRRIVWIGDRSAARVGYGWETSNITLHAISRDENAFPRPCLYCQVRKRMFFAQTLNMGKKLDGQ